MINSRKHICRLQFESEKIACSCKEIKSDLFLDEQKQMSDMPRDNFTFMR